MTNFLLALGISSIVLTPIPQIEVRDKLDLWIDKLSFCESGNREYIKILDANSKFSYGLLMFQKQTWLDQTKRFGMFIEAEPEEKMNFIYEGRYQKELAKKMIEDNYGAWRNWTVCTKKIGLPPQ